MTLTDGRLFLPIRPIPANADEYVIYLRGRPNLRFSDFGDIDALCVVGLLSYKMGRMGINKEYTITKMGRKLYASGLLNEELELERVDLLSRRTSDLKSALNLMMAGAARDRARYGNYARGKTGENFAGSVRAHNRKTFSLSKY